MWPAVVRDWYGIPLIAPTAQTGRRLKQRTADLRGADVAG